VAALDVQDEAMGLYDQLPAFIGVVVGAGMSFAATYWMDRTGWRRDQSTRWDERRLSAYLDYGNAVKELVTIADRLASNQPLESGIAPLERTPENLDKLAAAEARRTVATETLRLFADPDTGTAAREMTRCVWHLCWLAREAPDGDRSKWKRAFKDYEDARDDYMAQARKSLKITDPYGAAATPRLRSRKWPSTREEGIGERAATPID
jgi:hypothetical protein